jgi:hypothetical protein
MVSKWFPKEWLLNSSEMSKHHGVLLICLCSLTYPFDPVSDIAGIRKTDFTTFVKGEVCKVLYLYRASRLIYETSLLLWGEDSLPYSIYHDTRGEAFAIVNYCMISVYEANASPLQYYPCKLSKNLIILPMDVFYSSLEKLLVHS